MGRGVAVASGVGKGVSVAAGTSIFVGLGVTIGVMLGVGDISTLAGCDVPPPQAVRKLDITIVERECFTPFLIEKVFRLLKGIIVYHQLILVMGKPSDVIGLIYSAWRRSK